MFNQLMARIGAEESASPFGIWEVLRAMVIAFIAVVAGSLLIVSLVNDTQ